MPQRKATMHKQEIPQDYSTSLAQESSNVSKPEQNRRLGNWGYQLEAEIESHF